ncbi:MAG: hypothetical protein JHD16_14000 [Solirubrobacteraceae bacterium]|nr:hypothetical protein [Solirubrobacteraceae bacterium]
MSPSVRALQRVAASALAAVCVSGLAACAEADEPSAAEIEQRVDAGDTVRDVTSDAPAWPDLQPPQPDAPPAGRNLPKPNAEGRRFADAFVSAYADAVAADPPPGDIVRLIMIWFTDGTARYFAPGLVGEGDTEISSPDPDDPWEPVGTAGERGADQAFAVLDRAEIDRLLEAFGDSLPRDPDDPSESHPDFDDYAITAAVAQRIALAIEPALRERGLPFAARYAILFQYTSDDHAIEDFTFLNGPETRRLLADAGELPRFWGDNGEMLPVGAGG